MAELGFVASLATRGSAQSSPITAVASPSLRCPDTFHFDEGTYYHNSFEVDPSLIVSNEKWEAFHGSGVYPPMGTWAWSDNDNGIAGENSEFGIGNGPAPDGDFVLWLQSSTTNTSNVTLFVPLPGNAIGKFWRVSFYAAQRKHPAPSAVVDQQVVRIRVTMAGPTEVVFNEQIRDEVYRKYWTRPFCATATGFTIELAGTKQEATPHMALIDFLEFREVMPWDQHWTWSTQVKPTATDDVQIGASACVGILTGVANTVDVSGELLALEATQANLHSRSLLVHGADSLFQVGSEGVPYGGRFDLVLDDDSTAASEPVNALLAWDNAQVEMHGQPSTSWLRLAQNAAQYSNTIVVEHAPLNWNPNDRIVIASSDRDFLHAEEAVIAGISGGGPTTPATITLTTSLAHFHCGVSQPVNSPTSGQHVLDQRAEVGLLSRNVRVVGLPRNPPTQPGMGGHIMIRSDTAPPQPLTNPGFGRFSAVELENMGRAGQEGRYPIHWHLLLDKGRGQYFRNGSIHHSNLRVATIHGTDFVLFEDNVGFDHLGHGVFLEDGSEQDNVIRNNLILVTRRPAVAVIPSDTAPLDLFQNRAPASFWITNPHNTFEGNVAAGSEGTGYWFALPDQHLGLSRSITAAINYFAGRPSNAPPIHQTLGAFADNSCHSSWIAFDVNDGIDINTERIQTNLTWKPHTGQRQTLPGFLAYSCNVGLYTGNGDQNLVFDHPVLADNSWQLVMASHDIVRDAVVVRESGNGLWSGLGPGFPNYPGVAVVLYDGAAKLEDVHFVGFDGSIANTSFTQMQGAARRRTNIPWSGITWTGTNSLYLGLLQDVSSVPAPNSGVFTTLSEHDPRSWAFSIHNPDRTFATMGPSSRTTVVSNHPMMLFDPGTIEYTMNNAGAPARAYASPFRFGFLRVIAPELSGSPGPQAGVDPQFGLRYLRERSLAGGGLQTYVYEDRWLIDFYKQMAVVLDTPAVNNSVRYRLEWFDPTDQSANPPTSVPTLTEVRLGELSYGDAALIGFEHYVPRLTSGSTILRALVLQSNGAWDPDPARSEAVPQASSFAALTTPPWSQTQYFADPGGTLWLRIVAPSAPPGAPIQVHTDGLGQVIRINL